MASIATVIRFTIAIAGMAATIARVTTAIARMTAPVAGQPGVTAAAACPIAGIGAAAAVLINSVNSRRRRFISFTQPAKPVILIIGLKTRGNGRAKVKVIELAQ